MKKVLLIIISLLGLVVITNTNIVARFSGDPAGYESREDLDAREESGAETDFLDSIVASIKDFILPKSEEPEQESEPVEVAEKTETEKPAQSDTSREKPKREEPIVKKETVEEEPETVEEVDDSCQEEENATTTIEELIGNASVPAAYTGAPAHNVQLACDYHYGVVIPPDGVYSAFDILGDGGESMGFEAAAGLLSDGTTVDMFGSGICTVTTTIYQAGRDAGLTVVEVNDHVGAESSYAAAGDQAMFNYPTSDLKMRNDFDYPVVLYMGYHDGVIYAEWYSQKEE